MSDTALCCPGYPDDFVCGKLNKLLGQFQNSPKLKGFAQAILQQIDDVRCVLIKQCNAALDCENASGLELDNIGSLVGFPRSHCNVFCDPCSPLGVSDYTLSDADYCRFIKTQGVTNRGGCTVADMTQAAQALWGADAAVVHSGSGSVGVWPGRVLTDEEKRLYVLYKKVLPLCLGVNLVIYDTPEPIPSWCCPEDTWCDAIPACVLEDCSKLRPTNLTPMSVCLRPCDCASLIAADISCADNPPLLTFTSCECDPTITADV